MTVIPEPRLVAEKACREALAKIGLVDRLPESMRAGIVGSTLFGERYPEQWLAAGGRVRPHQFGAAVLNSVIGHCSIQLGLVGPQILLTRGSPLEVARLQLTMGRSELMILCDYQNPLSIAVAILRKEDL
jgi:hypothetical protein